MTGGQGRQRRRRQAVRYEINNGGYVGIVEWREPGTVDLHMEDPTEKAFFERYFSSENCYLGGPVESPEMTSEAPNESEEAFRRSTYRLTAYDYRITPAQEEGA
jgi:hypothetical protein